MQGDIKGAESQTGRKTYSSISKSETIQQSQAKEARAPGPPFGAKNVWAPGPVVEVGLRVWLGRDPTGEQSAAAALPVPPSASPHCPGVAPMVQGLWAGSSMQFPAF